MLFSDNPLQWVRALGCRLDPQETSNQTPRRPSVTDGAQQFP